MEIPTETGLLANISLKLNVTVSVHSALTGRLLKRISTRNLVPYSGRAQIRDLLLYPRVVASAAYTPGFIAVGSDGTATADTQTSMGAEVLRKRVSRAERFRRPACRERPRSSISSCSIRRTAAARRISVRSDCSRSLLEGVCGRGRLTRSFRRR